MMKQSSEQRWHTGHSVHSWARKIGLTKAKSEELTKYPDKIKLAGTDGGLTSTPETESMNSYVIFVCLFSETWESAVIWDEK